jgi:hypothetical protein
MKNLFLKIHIHLILARKFAKARKERRDIDRQRKAFETDQARVDARITGPAVTEYRANLIELRRLNTNYQIHLETFQDSLKGCPPDELRKIYAVLTGPSGQAFP